MGTAGAKAFGEMLQINTTLTQLNVSGNSFGRVQVGDSVKLKSTGEMCILTQLPDDDNEVLVTRADGSQSAYMKWTVFEWENQMPAFLAGIAASQSLLNVSASDLSCCCLKRLTSVPPICDSRGSHEHTGERL